MEAGRPDVVVVGDVMVDVSVESGSLARGGDVHGDVRMRPAGSGANAAVWASHAGATVRLFGRVGRDLPGRLVREALAERGVDARLAEDPTARTGAMLVVWEAGERSMVADRGANARLSPDDLPQVFEGSSLLVSGYLLFDPGSEQAARAALDRARGPHVAIDAASWPLVESYGTARFFEATAPATILLANEQEAEVLWRDRPAGSGRPLLPYRHVFTKLGDRGASYLDGTTGLGLMVRAPGGDGAKDPTGAGDAFDGTLLAALAQGDTIRQAMTRACDAGLRAATSPDTWPEP